jgi:RNA polymerase sigma-70 factor (ECF subfamily)
MEPFEDELLAIEKAIAGETQAMESLLQLHHERLLSYVTRHLPPDLKNIVDPMDVVQDTYFEACRQMAGFRPMGPDSFHRWLVTIARHRMVDLLRLYRARRRAVNWKQADDSVLYMLDQLAVYRRTPSRSAASHEFIAAVEQCLQRLPPDYRQVITLRHIEGLSVAETAARMNRRSEDVYVLCCRGLQAMRNELQSASIYL